jgi:hypothetical protein
MSSESVSPTTNGGEESAGPSVSDPVATAQQGLAAIAGFVESARASAAAAGEAQLLIAAALAEAQAKLAEITAAATQAASVKAQVASEQAATAESAATALAAIAEAQGRGAAALADAQAKLAEITAVGTQAVAAKTAITDEQAVIATKSDHIQKAQEHADKVRADLDRVLTAATQQATDAEGLKARSQAAADSSTTLLTEIRTTKGTIDSEAAAVAALRTTAEESTAVTKGLADRASVVESRVASYEADLANLKTQSLQQLKTIEDLLPGATGAGLAHAFNARRIGFLNPYKLWQGLFVVFVVALVGIGASVLWHAYHVQTPLTWEELGRLWLARLPVAGPLLWLALHASREAALAKRLEEDYGFKAAVASSLEGFQKKMAEVGNVDPNSPLAKLVNRTLATMSAPPGRIYDKQRLVTSPVDEAKDAAKALAEVLKPLAEAAKTFKPLG